MASKGPGDRYRVTNPFSVIHFAIVTGVVAAVVALGGLAQATFGFGNLILIGLLVPVAVRFYLIKRTALMVAPNGVTVDGRNTPWYEVHELVVIGPGEGEIIEVALRRRQDAERFVAHGQMQSSKYDRTELRAAFERLAPPTATLSGWGFEDTGQAPTPQMPGPPPSRGRAHNTIGLAALLAVLVVGGTIGTWLLIRGNEDRQRDRVRQQLQDTYPADALVRSSSRDPASLLEEVQQLESAEAAVPLIEGNGQIDGDAAVITNWINDASLTPYQIIEGQGPEDPDEVVIDQRTRETGVRIGDTIVVELPGTTELEPFTVVGIASLGALDDLCEIPFVFITSDTALEETLDGDARVGVLAYASDGVTERELVDHLRSLPDTEVLDRDALVTDRMQRCQ
jgi:hypothetical protein